MDEVAKIHEVTGGGHDGAAGITGQEDHELIMEQIIDQVKQILKKE